MIRFREATQGDLKGLLALYTQLNDNTMPEIDGRVTGTWERMLRQEQLHTLVAEEGGALLSTVTLIITESLTHGQRPFALVEYVVTDQNHRGQGLAFSYWGLPSKLPGKPGAIRSCSSPATASPAYTAYIRKQDTIPREKQRILSILIDKMSVEGINMKRRSKIILAIVFASVILLSSVGLLVFHLLTNPKVEPGQRSAATSPL